MKKIIKRIVLISLTLILIAISGVAIWTYRELKHHDGGFVDAIDPYEFVEKRSALGIKNVQLLSAEIDTFRLGNIVLREGVIDAITFDETQDPNIQYIDGNGNYLIPGLTDSHVHLLNSKNDLYLYLANGVTTVFEMYGKDRHIEWKKEAEAGAFSPNLFVASRKIGSRNHSNADFEEFIGQHLNWTSKEEVKKGVAKHKEEGYDALKLSSYLNLEFYNYILEEANEQDIPVVGHLDRDVGLDNMFGSGLSMLSHIEEIFKNTSAQFGKTYNDPDGYLEYLDSVINDIALKMKQENIAVSSTVWLGEQIDNQKFELEEFLTTIPLQYANSGVVEGSELYRGWLPGKNDYQEPEIMDKPDEIKETKAFLQAYEKALHKITRALLNHNVMIMAGTDTNVPGAVPGFSFHNELKSLTNAGLSNKEVLISAITAPANYIKSNTGRIEKGYKANLVLLSGNPLESIENTRKIEQVFVNGYSINKKQIERILSSIEAKNNDARKIEIAKYLK